MALQAAPPRRDDGDLCAGLGSKALGVVALVALLASGMYHTLLFKQYLPLYVAAECGNQTAELEEFTLGKQSIHLELRVAVACRNPNPYQLHVSPDQPGSIFIGHGPEALEAGKLVFARGSLSDHQIGGKIAARASVDVTGPTAEELLPHFLTDDAIPITMRLQFRLGVYVLFGFVGWGAETTLRKACGVHLQGVFADRGAAARLDGPPERLGRLVCGETWLDLAIPEVGERAAPPSDAAAEGRMVGRLAAPDVWRGELTRDLTLGLAAALSYCLAVVLPVYLWLVGLPGSRPSSSPALSSGGAADGRARLGRRGEDGVGDPSDGGAEAAELLTAAEES